MQALVDLARSGMVGRGRDLADRAQHLPQWHGGGQLLFGGRYVVSNASSATWAWCGSAGLSE